MLAYGGTGAFHKKKRERRRKRPKLRLPRGLRWKTLEARELLIAYVAREHPNTLNTDAMTEDWWPANGTRAFSKLLATCTVCGYAAGRPRIADIRQGGGFPCFCGDGGIQYASREGYDHSLSFANDYLSSLSEAERAWIFGETAVEVWRL